VFRHLVAQPDRVAAAEHRLRHADGHYVDIESVGVNLLNNPAVNGIVITSRDVSRRRRVEKMLSLVTSATDQSHDGVLISTGDRSHPEIVYVNSALLALTGFEEHELIGRTPHIFDGPGMADTIIERIETSLDTGSNLRFEVVNRSRDGREHPLEISIAPLKDESGRTTNFVLLCRDITEERKVEAERLQLEAALRQALKMEAVGTLAGGIAHDFNNVLLPMMMLTQLTINRLPPESRERQDLGRVLSAQKRAKSLVGQILAFSRGSSGEYGDVELAAICHETMTLLRASLPATVTLIESIRPRSSRC
jgi:PAS domain S-box-containing protein